VEGERMKIINTRSMMTGKTLRLFFIRNLLLR
jgi:hypothetical protein